MQPKKQRPRRERVARARQRLPEKGVQGERIVDEQGAESKARKGLRGKGSQGERVAEEQGEETRTRPEESVRNETKKEEPSSPLTTIGVGPIKSLNGGQIDEKKEEE